MNLRLDYCDEFYSEDHTHKLTFLKLGLQCDKCCEAYGWQKCHGCEMWLDPDKMMTTPLVPHHLFCRECIEENPHPCADPECDGIQFGEIKHCNICIGNSVKQLNN